MAIDERHLSQSTGPARNSRSTYEVTTNNNTTTPIIILDQCCGGILAVLALIFGIIAKKQIAEDPLKEGDGLATAGIVLGIIGIVIWVGYVVLVVASGG